MVENHKLVLARIVISKEEAEVLYQCKVRMPGGDAVMVSPKEYKRLKRLKTSKKKRG